MKYIIDNKEIEIKDENYDFLERHHEVNDFLFKYLLQTELTTGDLSTGVVCPDIEQYIKDHSPEELSSLISHAIEMEILVSAEGSGVFTQEEKGHLLSRIDDSGWDTTVDELINGETV